MMICFCYLIVILWPRPVCHPCMTICIIAVMVQCSRPLVLKMQLVIDTEHSLLQVIDVICCLAMMAVHLQCIYQAVWQRATGCSQTQRDWPTWLVQAGSNLDSWIHSAPYTVHQWVIWSHSFTFDLHHYQTCWHGIWQCCRHGWVVSATDSWWSYSVSILPR